MAFDLVARLKVIDNLSAPFKRMQRVTERMNNALKSTNISVTKMSSGMSRVSSAASRLSGSFVGLAAAIGGAVAAHKAFNATIGEAARYERSQGLITAMMGDVNKAKQLMSEIEKIAINSPLLNSQDMMSAASAFLPMTKDINRLKKLYDLSERLFVLNDKEGMEGASFALREFLMGKDAQSLVERFNLNRKVLNDLKNLSFDKAVKGLDELLNKMGVTRKTIDTIGNDTLAKWSQIKERMAVAFRQMGTPSLEVLNNFLTNLLNRLDSGDLTRFANIGANIIKQIITGMTNTATSLYNWFSSLTNSEEFKRRTTIFGKVQFVIEDIYQRFLSWLNNGGSKKIENTVSTLIQILTAAIDASIEVITPVAAKVGKAIGKGVLDGFNEAVKGSTLLQMLGSPQDTARLAKRKAIEWGARWVWDKIKGNKEKTPKGYAGGLNYVPYDNFPARLHRGEMVLTRGEAQEYRKNKGRAGGGFTIHIESMHVRQESDIKKIAHELARLIEREGALMA
ncbi:hypothetical protein HNQ85_000249 [Anoxybacillus calidus]|uniref:Phage tail tape measure protein n=1 Tax=[Anoxybacillus] calidus TaxID=575178 RepID=A0A7W0BTB2_9BACL|nr:hypothetical protein [Anoxybacillus calidus]MBA2869991.1 hypothetical protein [Anoxybacillus calidus]